MANAYLYDWTQAVSWILLIITAWVVLNHRRVAPRTMIGSIILVFIVLVLVNYVNDSKMEKFEEAAASANTTANAAITAQTASLENMVRQAGFSSVAALRQFLQGNYEENLQTILYDNALTLYYSVFSTTSLPQAQARTWKNISPYFKIAENQNTCKLTPDELHLQFGDVPYSNRFIGLELVSNNIIGPESYQMGVQGNGTFTIFSVLKFNGFPPSNTKPYELFKLYGNTVNNNAVSLVIQPQPFAAQQQQPPAPPPIVNAEENFITTVPVPVQANTYNVQIDVSFGTQTMQATHNGLMNIPITLSNTYMFVLTKTNTKVVLTMHDMTKKGNEHLKLVEAELSDPVVLLSNKAMSINSDRNLNANIYAFGVYNMNLLDESFLHNHIYQELYKLSDEFLSQAKTISAFQQQLDDTKACPYDKEICEKCKEVTDWTDFHQVLAASADCKKAIDEYCAKNTTDPKCKCWDPNTSSGECKSYVNIFRSKTCLQVENLDVETLEQIKKKYNLCACNDIDKIKESLKESGACMNQDILISNPTSKPEPEDINFYNKSIVGTGYDGLMKQTANELTSNDEMGLDAKTQGNGKKGFFYWLFGW